MSLDKQKCLFTKMGYKVNLKGSEISYLQEYGLSFILFLLENTPDPASSLDVFMTYDVNDNTKVNQLPNNITIDLDSFEILNEFEECGSSRISGINFTFRTPQSPKLVLPDSKKGIKSLLKNENFIKELGFGLSSSRPELRPLIFCFENIKEFKIGMERAFITFSEKITDKNIKSIKMELITFRKFMVGVACRIDYNN